MGTKIKRELSSQAAAAAMIRKELKAAFPYTTFKVTSKGYSMGDHVNIDWTDGPMSDKVEAIVGKYEYGHFDGMIDLYEYSNRRDDIPQSKYVMTNRHQSDETFVAIVAYLNNHWGYALEVVENKYGGKWISNDKYDGNDWQSRKINREFHKTSLICDDCKAPIQFRDNYCPACGSKQAEAA